MENNNNNRAVASLVLGLVSIVTWLFPIAGYITTILAIVFATKGRHSEKKRYGDSRSGTWNHFLGSDIAEFHFWSNPWGIGKFISV